MVPPSSIVSCQTSPMSQWKKVTSKGADDATFVSMPLALNVADVRPSNVVLGRVTTRRVMLQVWGARTDADAVTPVSIQNNYEQLDNRAMFTLDRNFMRPSTTRTEQPVKQEGHQNTLTDLCCRKHNEHRGVGPGNQGTHSLRNHWQPQQLISRETSLIDTQRH